ncbi:cell division protein FtsW (lipid II flippase) [Evansella vedderi]|uniref:Cell division protein FtsW (Lipid II flippase) n=1 Tax=Evansella vedderi TaxID=38282 RepID=A0ABT9ZRG0_9BACI|nr:FtsW/RodA/SpoVE family cell cycle protein [Evansella vedderi]MDQ0253043.1 cell division protein FtsW (lipid II flippase) [Evansella vedderi]
MSRNFDEFLTKVTSKVKSKVAHGMIKKELTNHLKELSHAYQKGETTKEEADQKAIQEMGNPYTIGENLNHLHKARMDWSLLALFITIAGISFLPLVGGIPHLSMPGPYFIGRQATWYTLAILVILGFLFFDYRKLKKLCPVFYGVALTLLLYTHFFGLEFNGAQRWIVIGEFIADVTITLFLFFIAWAGIFTKINYYGTWKKQGLLLFLFWIPILIYLALPNYMLSFIYFFTVVAMFVFSGVKKKLAIQISLTNCVVGFIVFIPITYVVTSTPHMYNRLLAFFNPEAYAQTAGYINMLIRDVLLQAGWFGNGLLTGNPLPEGHTDFAFPYLVYSLGWVFGIFLCLLLLLFILRISLNAFKTKDLFGRLLVIGGAALFTVPICWNILMGLGLLPIMGVSLPFISYGGTMLLFYAAVLGLILNVYRRKDIVEPTIETSS